MNATDSEQGIKTLAASRGVDETLDRLESVAQSHGMTVFARINFSKDAAAVGLTLQPTQLLILGNPASDTPLMEPRPISRGLLLRFQINSQDFAPVAVTLR